MNLLYSLFRFAFGGLFVYASFDKVLDPAGFAVLVDAYRILPDVLVNPTAIILPWLELFVGLCIIFDFLKYGALFLGNMLLAVFWAALLYNYARGVDVSCGCFSTDLSEESNMTWYVIRDSLFLLLGLATVVSASLRPPKRRRPMTSL